MFEILEIRTIFTNKKLVKHENKFINTYTTMKTYHQSQMNNIGLINTNIPDIITYTPSVCVDGDHVVVCRIEALIHIEDNNQGNACLSHAPRGSF